MSNQYYQDPNQYLTPHLNPPQQPRQSAQPLANTHSDRPGQQAYPPYPGDSLQPPPSGQRHGSRSPRAATVPFPVPQYGGSTSHPQAYIPPSPSQTTQNLTVATHHQHGRRGSHGHSPTGSSSDGQRSYPAGVGLDTGAAGSSNFYSSQPGVQPQHGGGYTTTPAQSQDWNAGRYEGAQGQDPWPVTSGVHIGQLPPQVENATGNDGGHDTRTKAPPNRPAGAPAPLCRYPHCRNHVFFDRRVNELREWCSEQHMQAAIMHRVEKACNDCGAWPRRNGYRRCSGNICRYPRY